MNVVSIIWAWLPLTHSVLLQLGSFFFRRLAYAASCLSAFNGSRTALKRKINENRTTLKLERMEKKKRRCLLDVEIPTVRYLTCDVNDTDDKACELCSCVHRRRYNHHSYPSFFAFTLSSASQETGRAEK